MAKRPVELVTHTFRGGRFEDHGLDVDVLPELVAYKTLLTETAKELWRRNHPNRERLPRNFEDSLRLKFFELRDNCVSIPLLREIEAERQGRLFQPEPDELDRAVALVARVIQAAEQNTLIPEEFPRDLLVLFDGYGKSMEDDEVFEQTPANGTFSVCYRKQTRAKLTELSYQDYEDDIDYSGEVCAADLEGRFALRLENGTKVSGVFTREHESLITEALKEHASQRLRVRGRAEFSGATGKIKKIVGTECFSLQPAEGLPYDGTARPIWEIAEELSSTVPDDEWAKLPSDGAKNLNYYLYGHPKIEE